MPLTTGTISGDLAAAAHGEWPARKISMRGNGSNYGGLGRDPENEAAAAEANAWHEYEEQQAELVARIYEALVGHHDAELAETKQRLMVELGQPSIERFEGDLGLYLNILRCDSCQTWYDRHAMGASLYRCGSCGVSEQR